MKILQRVKMQHSKCGTEVTNIVSLLLFSLKSSKEINTKIVFDLHGHVTETKQNMVTD